MEGKQGKERQGGRGQERHADVLTVSIVLSACLLCASAPALFLPACQPIYLPARSLTACDILSTHLGRPGFEFKRRCDQDALS